MHPKKTRDMRTSHVTARISPEDEAIVLSAAGSLGTSLSEFIVASLRVSAGEVSGSGWECRTVYMLHNRIVGVGEALPEVGDGLPLPAAGFPLVATRSFWAMVESELRQDQLRTAP